MNEINERIKVLRNSLKLNQENFGKAIGLSKSGISNIENGTRNVTGKHIKLISNEFNVSEEWLRDGVGEMFIETDSTIISKLSAEYNLDSLDVDIIEHYLKLSPSHREIIKNFVKSIAKSIANNEEITATKEVISEKNQDMAQNDEGSVEKELNAYRLELEAEKKGKISSVSEDTSESLTKKLENL